MTNPVALVTGASRGIGARTALALAGAGYDIVCAARSTRESPGRVGGTVDEVADQVRSRSRRAMALPLDVTDERAVARGVASVYDQFGRCDVLVNNAGVIATKPALGLSLRQWHTVIEVNLTGPFLMIRELYPRMRDAGGGRIVNITSGAVDFPPYPFASYSASKAALEVLSQQLGLQSQPEVAINALRVDAVVRSEGLAAVQGEAAAEGAEDPDDVARTIAWVAQLPLATSGRIYTYSAIAAGEARP